MEKGGALKMMSDEALSAFRRNVMDQTELVWHTRETVLTLIDEVIRLRKELDKRMWSTNAPDASQAPCYCATAADGDWPCKFCRELRAIQQGG